MIRKSLTLTAAVVLISAMTAMACGKDAGEQTSATQAGAKIASETPQQVTWKGELVCLGCSLKAIGAKSACSEFGCSHTLKTADGRYVAFLQNNFSKALLAGKDMHNKPIEITGTFFANANVLDVQSYAVDGGKEISWCDHCKGMDACTAKAAKTSGSY